MSATTMNGSTAGKQLKSGKALDSARKQTNSPGAGDSRNKQQSQPQAPKAWSGQNPSTLRASSSTTPTINGTDKALPKLPQQAQQKMNGDGNNEKHANDRAVFLLANGIGQDTTITLKNGEQFTGIFSGSYLENGSKQQFTLKMTRRTRAPIGQQVNGNSENSSELFGEDEDHTVTFDVQDVDDLDLQGVNTAASQPSTNGSITSSFRTDTEISSRGPGMLRERELQRWDAGEGESLEDMALESGGATGWDQFATNQRMYGVQSTYDENIYTTAIDRNNPQYKQREAEAARIAREIEGSSAADAHIAEERRRDAERGDGLDEEEKYSGVRRDVALPKRAVGAYVPPSQRPITSTPTVRGAPFDPAIISTTKPAIDKPADVAGPSEQPASQDDQDSVVAEPSTAATTGASTSTPSPAAKKATETTAEDHIRNTTDAFKQFANNEKLRVRQTQETKRMAARHEKNVKLNDLKKFAANFKLKSRVPDDLVPILAKDHEKQVEIQKRADDAYKEEELRATERAKQKATGPPSDITSPSSTKETEPSVSDRSSSTMNHRARMSQNLRGSMMGGQPTGRGIGNVRSIPPYGRPPIQPLPENMRMPAGPSGPPPMHMQQDAGPMSPGAAKRLNVNAKAFEFRPGANAFTPTGATPSPQRKASSAGKTASARSFHKKAKAPTASTDEDLNGLKWPSVTNLEFSDDQKKSWAANGGQPQPYRAPPTWTYVEKNNNTTTKDLLPKPPQVPSHGPSPMHTPGPNMGGQMPHAHQLPPHLQQGPPMSIPSQRPQYMAPQHPGPHPGQFDPRMAGQPMYGPNGSVQNSPRFPQAQMAYGPQMQMPQFAGQPGYGMSPSMQYRQPNMPHQNGGMMMQPHMQPNQFPPMPQAPFPRPPQYNNQPMQGQPPFMNGPHQGGTYSPMPPHAQPQHMGPPPQGPYNASPRPGPHMMAHTNSHQGFQGGGMMQQPPFAPSPAHHGLHMGPRQYSHGGGPPPQQYGGLPQMTPRQGQAMPHQPGMSPMGGGMQQGGEDGK